MGYVVYAIVWNIALLFFFFSSIVFGKFAMKVFLVGAFLQTITFFKAILGMFREPDVWCTAEQLLAFVFFFLILLWGYRSSKKRVARAIEDPERYPLIYLFQKHIPKKNQNVVAGYVDEFVEDEDEFVEDEDEFIEDEDEFVEDEDEFVEDEEEFIEEEDEKDVQN